MDISNGAAPDGGCRNGIKERGNFINPYIEEWNIYLLLGTMITQQLSDSLKAETENGSLDKILNNLKEKLVNVKSASLKPKLDPWLPTSNSGNSIEEWIDSLMRPLSNVVQYYSLLIEKALTTTFQA